MRRLASSASRRRGAGKEAKSLHDGKGVDALVHGAGGRGGPAAAEYQSGARQSANSPRGRRRKVVKVASLFGEERRECGGKVSGYCCYPTCPTGYVQVDSCKRRFADSPFPVTACPFACIRKCVAKSKCRVEYPPFMLISSVQQDRSSNRACVVADGLSWCAPGHLPVFENVSISLGQEKTGLVGANGSGKTTLTRILAGDLAPSAGVVRRAGTVARLPQDLSGLARYTVAQVFGVEERLAALHRLLAGVGAKTTWQSSMTTGRSRNSRRRRTRPRWAFRDFSGPNRGNAQRR